MPAELDQLDPAMSATPGAEPDMGADATPDMGAEPTGLAGGEVDHEGAMAKGELIKLASYAEKLQEHMQDDEQLEAWVQAKITMAAQNIASVYHYMAYEKKIGEYGDQLENNPALSEGQKQALSSYLMEAKMKIKELKKAQAEKIKSKKEEKMDEGIDGPCPHCGGAGHVTREIPAHVKGKVDAYNRLTKATHAAHKRLDANHNGIPDEDEMEEDFETHKGGKVTTNKDASGKRTGITHIGKPEWQADQDAYEPPKKEKAKGLSAAEKAPAKAMDKAQNKDYKAAKKANPTGVRRYQDGKQVDEAPNEGNEFSGELAKARSSGAKSFNVGGKDFPVKEGAKQLVGKQKKLDVNHNNKLDKADFAALRAGKKVDEEQTMSRAAKEMEKDSKNYGRGIMGALRRKYDQPLDEQGDNDTYDIIRTDDYGKKDFFAGNYSLEQAKDELAKCLAHPLHTKYGHKFAIVKRNEQPIKEFAPGAGLSKAKKSAVVKDAKAGKDIGKPGKGFDKLAKKAGGGEKGEKIAAAAMWKNIKETTAYVEAKKNDDIANKAEKMRIAKGTGTGIKGAIKDVVSGLKGEKPAHTNEALAESADMTRMREQIARLNRNERQSLNESGEVASIRALTKRLNG
jgi:hypothetical protein